MFFCTFFTGGAAERAGLHSGDKIIKVFTPCFVIFFIISCRWTGSVYDYKSIFFEPRPDLFFYFNTLSWVSD